MSIKILNTTLQCARTWGRYLQSHLFLLYICHVTQGNGSCPFQTHSSPPPPPPLGICLLISKMLQMAHSGASEKVQMADLRDRIEILFEWFMMDAIYLQINVSLLEPVITPITFLHLKRSKVAAYSCSIQSFFFPTSLVRTWKQQCKYLHILGWNYKPLLKSERPRCFWQWPTPGRTFFCKYPTMGKEKWKKLELTES